MEGLIFRILQYSNYSTVVVKDHYLFLQVEPRKVFFVLWAWLYEQEYMDTVTKQTHHA